MEREHWQAVEEAYARLAELDADACRRELDVLRRQQPDVASEVESLLAAQAAAGTFLADGWQKPSDDAAASLVGRTIGPYHVLAVLGEGGMGAVYLAEQHAPLQRRVALKVIKAGFDSREVVARFQSERQAVAMMDHANIAKVFDAGVSDLGRPYFVMEYVEGARITEYCDAQRLSVLDRARLMTVVCSAVQHAHQKGIIHRDLKPSNVLVTAQDGVATPKIIDFGIAKAIHPSTEDTLQTELGTTMGTPGYMSPEQAERGGYDIDTRTDVYSLGALLYELLVGVLPFEASELRRAGPVGAARILREQEPVAPSMRLARLGAAAADHAARRSTDVDGLRRQLRGDLDRIVLKALDPDRERRYETARDLSLDLMRHLNDEPVVARTPSLSYRARKFARRHRAGVAAGAVATFALAAGLAGTILGLFEANRQREVAAAQAAKSEAINGFLKTMLSAADPGRNGRDVRVVDVLDRAAGGVDKDFAGQPEIAASIRQTLGETMVALGQYQKAEAQFASALDIRRRVLGEASIDTLTSMDGLAESLYYQDQLQKAVAVFEQSWKTKTRAFGPDHPDTIKTAGDLAGIISELGRHAEAESMYRSVLASSQRHPELESTVTQTTLNNLALVLKREKRLDEAAELYARAIEIQRRALGEANPLTLNTQHNLAMLYSDSGKAAAAEALHREVLVKKRRVFGDGHPQTFASWNGLAEALCHQQRYDEGVRTYVDLLDHGRTALGEKSRLMAVYRRHYGACLTAKGDYPAADEQLKEALAAMTRISPTHLDTQSTLIELIRLDEAWGRPQSAAAHRAQLEAARTPAKAPSPK